MSKELESLEPSVLLEFIDGLLKRYENKTDYNIYITKDWLLEIKQSLQRLESIDNANPSEALECVLYFEAILPDWQRENKGIDCLTTIKQALLKAQKEHKALEIISKKNVDMLLIKKYDNVSDYNSAVWLSGREKLTEDEFKLLKEVLELI